MKHFDRTSEFKEAAKMRGFFVRTLSTDHEDPFVHYVAKDNKKIVGYFSDGYGFLAETGEDVTAIHNDRSDYYVYPF